MFLYIEEELEKEINFFLFLDDKIYKNKSTFGVTKKKGNQNFTITKLFVILKSSVLDLTYITG